MNAVYLAVGRLVVCLFFCALFYGLGAVLVERISELRTRHGSFRRLLRRRAWHRRRPSPVGIRFSAIDDALAADALISATRAQVTP
jgi:hypothetical protein